MNAEEWTLTYRDVIADALKGLSRELRRTTNLYLETVPYQKGSVIGPEFQKIRARQRSILVFADDDPMANFGHRCRYRFYDDETHAFLYEVAAQFPPHLRFVPSTFKVFHEPVRPRRAKRKTPLEITPAPTPAPAPGPPPLPRERYAILFSGSSDRRHLNDLEYCYRMLTKRYEFKPANICVLNFDNTRSINVGGVANNWPAETNSPDPYQIPVPPPPPPPAIPPPQPLLSAPADRDGFQRACQLIKEQLHPQDLVFIHTNGHGGALDMNLDGLPEDAWLVEHDEGNYYTDQFCEDLAILPEHESLLIVMQQCYSGEFIGPVMAAVGSAPEQIKAKRLSIACASRDRSYSNEERTFDMFMYGWITAHLDEDPYGNPPSSVVDTGGVAGIIEASEAYAYAASVNVAHPLDKPDCASSVVIPPAPDLQLT